MSYLDNIIDLESITADDLEKCRKFMTEHLGERPNFIFIDKNGCFHYEFMFADYRDLITYYPEWSECDIWSSVGLIGEL